MKPTNQSQNRNNRTPKELVDEAKAATIGIGLEETGKLLAGEPGRLILDVREPSEFKDGHLPGAFNIPRGLLEFKIHEQVSAPASPLLVYCHSGGRSALAAQTLGVLGFTDILDMREGWKGWSEAGYQVEK